MGNNIGKTLGTVGGAILTAAIPGVGALAAAGIMAATQAAGSGVDALADIARQEEARRQAVEIARRQAEEAKRQVESQAEAARIKMDRALETQRQREQAEYQRQQDGISQAQQQITFVQQILDLCVAGNVAQIPGLLRQMDENHFNNVLGQRPLAVCNSADTREQVQRMLFEEEERREMPNVEHVLAAGNTASSFDSTPNFMESMKVEHKRWGFHNDGKKIFASLEPKRRI